MALGELLYWDDVDGVYLGLRGGPHETWRVYAGPSADKIGGQLNIYRENVPLVVANTTDRFDGRLYLYGGGAGGSSPVWLLRGGTARSDGGERTGFLTLRAFAPILGDPFNIVELGPRGGSGPNDARRGDIKLKSAGAERVHLSIDDDDQGHLGLSQAGSPVVSLGARQTPRSLRGTGMLRLSTVAYPHATEMESGDPVERVVVDVAGWGEAGNPDRKLGRLLLYDSHPNGDSGRAQTHSVDLGIRSADRGGYLEVRGRNADGSARTITIDVDGIHGDALKEMNFVAENPDDPRTDLYYCAPEGPEAAIYVRGSAHLERGRATVVLPSHFHHLASPSSVTVQLTPRSARSKGVAAIDVGPGRFEIRELGRGRGAYRVDWHVHAVRRGKESYQVVRPRGTGSPLGATAGDTAECGAVGAHIT